MRVLRFAVLAADAVPLLCVLIIRFALPVASGQDGEASFWGGLLLVYALFLVLGLALVLNIVYLAALTFMRGRYDNDYGAVSRTLLFLLPAATALAVTVR